MSDILIYCEVCDSHQPLYVEPMSSDDLNDSIWGDLLCETCRFVIATITVPEAGLYAFHRVES